MRLAFVLFHWFPYGGMQRDLVKIVKACQHQAEIHIYCMSWEGETLPGVVTHILPEQGWTAVGRRQHFVVQIQQQVVGNFDLVIGFNRMPGLDYYFAADNSFAWRALNQRSVWYRMTSRARQYMAHEEAVFGEHSGTIALLLSRLQRHQYEAVYRTPAHRLIDIPPGISTLHCATEEAPTLRKSLRQEFQLKDDDLLILQIGTSFNTKGVDRSLAALASLPEGLQARVHYLLLGQDDPEPWLQLAARLGLKQLYIQAGREDIPRCMQGADLLLHPSRHESAGMVILEAVVAGLPVLTTAACGYAMHVEQAAAGMVCTEPFRQAQLNANLHSMLTSDLRSWRASGIAYGKTRDLYSMPDKVAELLLAGVPRHD